MDKLMDVRTEGERTVLHILKGHLLADDNEAFKEEFEAALPSLGRETILDLREVEYISSLILASMMYILKRMSETKRELILSNIQPKVHELLRVTNLDKIFRIE